MSITYTKTYKRSSAAIAWFSRPAQHLSLVEQWAPSKFTETSSAPDEFTKVVTRIYPDAKTLSDWAALTTGTEQLRKTYEDLHGITWTKTIHDSTTNITTTSHS